MSAATLEILAKMLALVRKCGLDSQEFLEVLTGTMFGSRVHRIYGSKIAGQQYAAGGFVFPLALKDIRLALNEAESAGVPMPSVSVVPGLADPGFGKPLFAPASALTLAPKLQRIAQEVGLSRDATQHNSFVSCQSSSSRRGPMTFIILALGRV